MLHPENYSNFGKIVTAIAWSNNINSQVQLKQALGLNASKVHGLLLGKIKPTPEIVELIKGKLIVPAGDYEQLKLEAIRSHGWVI